MLHYTAWACVSERCGNNLMHGQTRALPECVQSGWLSSHGNLAKSGAL